MNDIEASPLAQQDAAAPESIQSHKPGWKFSSLALLLGAALGVVLFVTSGLSSLVMGFVTAAGDGFASLAALPYFSGAWTAALFAGLLLPGGVLAFLSLRGKQPRLNLARFERLPLILLLCVPVLLVIGAAALKVPPLALLVVPPVQLMVLCAVFLFFFSLGVNGLRAGTPLRQWGTAAFGLLAVPFITILLELVVLVIVVILFALWASQQPELMAQFTLLTEGLTDAAPDMEALQEMLAPLVANPAVAFTILALAAGIVPLIEELFKPLAVWLLAIKGLAPSEGFVYGMISGLCFAVFESALMLANAASADSWVMVVLARCGTGLLHMTTAGLTGAAIANLRAPGGWLKLAAAFILAVGLHGLWNLFGAASGLLALKPENSALLALGTAAPYFIGSLMAFMTALLVLINRRLRMGQTAQA